MSRVASGVDQLAERCRFRDCGHDTEPGCAVLFALDTGELSETRLKAWRKLLREARGNAARQEAWKRREEARRFGQIVRGIQKAKRDRGW